MNALRSTHPQHPVKTLTEAVRYWKQQGELVRRKLDRMGERAALETNVNIKSLPQCG